MNDILETGVNVFFKNYIDIPVNLQKIVYDGEFLGLTEFYEKYENIMHGNNVISTAMGSYKADGKGVSFTIFLPGSMMTNDDFDLLYMITNYLNNKEKESGDLCPGNEYILHFTTSDKDDKNQIDTRAKIIKLRMIDNKISIRFKIISLMI